MQAVVRSTSHNHTQVLDCRDHSALMLAARITLPHLSVSSAMSLPKPTGVMGIGHTAEFRNMRLHGAGRGEVTDFSVPISLVVSAVQAPPALQAVPSLFQASQQKFRIAATGR